MAWIDTVATIAERHGLTFPEFLVMDVIRTAFPMTEPEVIKFATRFFPEADSVVIRQCIHKGWLSKSSSDETLQITLKGALIAQEIADELHQHA
jgi:hypothetical protein